MLSLSYYDDLALFVWCIMCTHLPEMQELFFILMPNNHSDLISAFLVSTCLYHQKALQYAYDTFLLDNNVK